MIGEIIGSLISAGAGLIGAQENRDAARENNERNIAMQREFAQNGVSWRVDDARRAGVHPLYALGANTTSFNNVTGDTGIGDGIKNAGQDIGRAVSAGLKQEDRDYQDKVEQLTIQKMGLENDMLATQAAASKLRLKNLAGSPPALPLGDGSNNVIPGQPVKTVSGYPVKDDDIKQKGEDFPQTKISRPFGYPVLANPYFGDGQSFEDRYGDSEIGSTIKFGVNTVADHMYTAHKKFVVPAWRRSMSTRWDGRPLY